MNAFRILFLIAGLTVGFATSIDPAWADCDTTGHGVPGISNTSATSSSILVSWLLLCPLHPTRMELRQGGTSQSQWQDGMLLGSIDLAPGMNGGGVPASHLMSSTRYADLRLCSVYTSPDFESWCTDLFGVSTAQGPSGLVPPSGLSVTLLSTADPMDVTARATIFERNYKGDAYLTTAPPSRSPPSGWHVDSSIGESYTVDVYHLVDGPIYTFSACNKNAMGEACVSAVVNTPAPPPAPQPALPLRAPTRLQAAWNGATDVKVTWVPAQNSRPNYLNVYHKAATSPESNVPPVPWALVGSHLGLEAMSFDDTRPHILPLRHIYRVCAVDGDTPSREACTAPVGAPP